jgi:hypothetical protein
MINAEKIVTEDLEKEVDKILSGLKMTMKVENVSDGDTIHLVLNGQHLQDTCLRTFEPIL